MKSKLLVCALLLAAIIAHAQNIESVVSEKFSPITVTPGVPALDAANLIVEEFNKWAAIKCSKTLNTTLSARIEEARAKFTDVIPKNTTAEFLCLVDKFNCNVIAIVQKTQVVRVKKNVCSVNDIKLVMPDLVYDPDKTGFFSIKIQF